ncbi:collagen triple helix repeat-containing protein 1-like [Lingula anatina]|nr:collagen triple helix repeat-containing protein 1-like [Lingula anatina]|eukprot:XP_013420291.1 collagen triple helix repeat-containing protein 1-like [Lingula anatina]
MKTHLMVEETRLGQDISAIVSNDGSLVRLAVFNRVQSYWHHINDHDDVDSNIASISYTKKSAISSLHVVWSINSRVYHDAQCSRWFVTFNGAECSDPGNIESVIYEDDVSGNSHSDWYQPNMIEGICHGLSAGSISVNLAVGYCGGYGAGDAHSGWQSGTFAMVEEVFMGA